MLEILLYLRKKWHLDALGPWGYPLIIIPETAVSTPVPDPETRVARANKCPPKNYYCSARACHRVF